MNIFNKISFILIIFYVIVPHVLSEFVKRADGSQCTSQGGQCMNPNNCNGTVKTGLCPGGNDNRCCIPPAPPAQSNDGSKCTNQGGQCKNPSSCDGNVLSGLCPGGEDNKCCIPKPPEQKSAPAPAPAPAPAKSNNDSKCTSKGGQCMNPNNCSGKLLNNLCPGGNDNKCCIPKPAQKSTPTTKKSSPVNNGSQCTSKGGRCLNVNQNKCNGSFVKNLCPGDANIQCCIGSKTTPKTSNKSKPTSTVKKSSQCANRGGRCLNVNQNKCNGSFVKNLCPGDAHIQCCIGSKTTGKTSNKSNSSNKSKPTNRIKNDRECVIQGGRCLNIKANTCNGTIKQNLCPGNSNIRCCIDPRTKQKSPSTNKPSTSNKSTASNKPSTGSNGSYDCDISLTNTSLSREEFASKLKNYASSMNSESWSVFSSNAELIYDVSIEKGFNPELVVVRAMSEGFSPGKSRNNYWGFGCPNGKSVETCTSFSSFEEGINKLISTIKNYGTDTAYGMMLIYSDLGDYWLTDPRNPKGGIDWGAGGCPYFPYIKNCMTAERAKEVEAACSGGPCTGHEENCLKITDADESCYAKWQVSEMQSDRKAVFNVGC